MRGQKEKILTFLLIGLLALSACSAPGAESPTPAPEPTPTATESPAPTPTPAPEPTPTPTPERPTELWGFPIDDTHDAFEVPTGGKLGTVLVTVEWLNKDDLWHLNFSVWKSDDLTTPIQTMTPEGERHWGVVEDINFDGYLDFMYLSSRGAANEYCSFWVWDEEQEQFFEKGWLANPGFDTETQIISSYMHYSAWSGVQSYWRWENGELIMLRRIETHYPEFGGETATQLLTVEDRINGELTEVYRKTFGDPDNGEIFEEAVRWDDLNYHGE